MGDRCILDNADPQTVCGQPIIGKISDGGVFEDTRTCLSIYRYGTTPYNTITKKMEVWSPTTWDNLDSVLNAKCRGFQRAVKEQCTVLVTWQNLRTDNSYCSLVVPWGMAGEGQDSLKIVDDLLPHPADHDGSLFSGCDGQF